MFGFGSKTIVGLDVGSSSIKAVELKKGRNGIEVAHLGLEPLAPDIVVDSMIVDNIWSQRFQPEVRHFNPVASFFQLDCLDARRAHIQTHNRLRSKSKHVPALSTGFSPASFVGYGNPAALAAAFFLLFPSIWLDFSSIH